MQINSEDVLARLLGEAEARFPAGQREGLRVIGIHRGGVWLARRLHQALGLPDEIGELDIGFHRDDYGVHGMQSEARPSRIPFDVNAARLILVDDVLHTGRTIRAAMNEIFDYGRPAHIWLAVLVDRPGRQLPIQADMIGLRLEQDLPVKLRGPNPLHLEVLG